MRKRRVKRTNSKILKVLGQTLIELLAGVKYNFIKELGKIAVIIQILIPVFIANREISIVNMILVSCILLMAVKYIKEIGYKLNHSTERGFPIPIKRFTQQDKDGFVGINDDELQEAILYLCDVEDYLNSKGWL